MDGGGQAGQEGERGMGSRPGVPFHLQWGGDGSKGEEEGGSKAPRPGGPGRGGVQEEGCHHRSHRGKAGKEDKTGKQAPTLDFRALGTFSKARHFKRRGESDHGGGPWQGASGGRAALRTGCCFRPTENKGRGRELEILAEGLVEVRQGLRMFCVDTSRGWTVERGAGRWSAGLAAGGRAMGSRKCLESQ